MANDVSFEQSENLNEGPQGRERERDSVASVKYSATPCMWHILDKLYSWSNARAPQYTTRAHPSFQWALLRNIGAAKEKSGNEKCRRVHADPVPFLRKAYGTRSECRQEG